MECNEYEKMRTLEDENWWYQSRKVLIHRLVQKYVPHLHSILDIGCGNGMVLDSFSNIPVRVGVETHPIGVKFARERGLSVVNNLNQVVQSFDAVLLMDVLEHIPDDHMFLTQALSKLSSDGVAIVTVPAFQWLWSAHDEKVHHIRRYSKTDLRTLIHTCHAPLKHLSYWNASFFIPSFLRKRSGLFSQAESDLTTVPAPINRLLQSVLEVENRLSMRRFPFPFGTSVYAVVGKPPK